MIFIERGHEPGMICCSCEKKATNKIAFCDDMTGATKQYIGICNKCLMRLGSIIEHWGPSTKKVTR